MQKNKYFWLIMLLTSLVLSNSSCSPQRNSLEIEAQVTNKTGEAQPVSKQSFYLLSKDPTTIDESDSKYVEKRESYKTSQEKTEFVVNGAMLNAVVESAKKIEDGDIVKSPLLYAAAFHAMEGAKPVWELYLVKEVQTDSGGKAVFDDIPAGDYWLLAQANIAGTKNILWNLKVSLKSGRNELLLNEKNAVFSYKLHF